MDPNVVKKVKMRAIHLLEYMDRTEQELREKLQRSDYPPEAIDEAIGYLKVYGYIDDKRYAGQYMSSRLEKKGRRRLFQELYQKGIHASLVQEAWDELCLDEEVDEKQRIGKLVEKKTGGQTLLSRKEYHRLISFLGRRGFSWEDISSVFQEKDIRMDLSAGDGEEECEDCR